MLKLNVLKLLAAVGFLISTIQAQGATVKVSITNAMQFSPNLIHIQAGDTVQFVNESRGTHTVTADTTLAADPANVLLPAGAAPFNSGRLTPGKIFTHAFKVPGLYQYICLPHELHGMRGQIQVH